MCNFIDLIDRVIEKMFGAVNNWLENVNNNKINYWIFETKIGGIYFVLFLTVVYLSIIAYSIITDSKIIGAVFGLSPIWLIVFGLSIEMLDNVKVIADIIRGVVIMLFNVGTLFVSLIPAVIFYSWKVLYREHKGVCSC